MTLWPETLIYYSPTQLLFGLVWTTINGQICFKDLCGDWTLTWAYKKGRSMFQIRQFQQHTKIKHEYSDMTSFTFFAVIVATIQLVHSVETFQDEMYRKVEQMYGEEQAELRSLQVWTLTQIFFCFVFVKTHWFAWRANQLPLHRGNTVLFRSSQQLPRLRLGPLKGFLSWHCALHGHSTCLARCFQNYRDTRTLSDVLR